MCESQVEGLQYWHKLLMGLGPDLAELPSLLAFFEFLFVFPVSDAAAMSKSATTSTLFCCKLLLDLPDCVRGSFLLPA